MFEWILRRGIWRLGLTPSPDWWTRVRLIATFCMAIIVLVVLVTSFSAIILQAQPETQAQASESRINTEAHMVFTRQLAAQESLLATMHEQIAALSQIPERQARFEERLDNMVRMVYAILGGVFTLLVKEIGALFRYIKGRNFGGPTKRRQRGDD